MLNIQWRNIFLKSLLFFILLSCIHILHKIIGLPDYDLLYILLLTVLLTIGDQWAWGRFICFTLVLFLLDISFGFILIPIILYILAWKHSLFKKKMKNFF